MCGPTSDFQKQCALQTIWQSELGQCRIVFLLVYDFIILFHRFFIYLFIYFYFLFFYFPQQFYPVTTASFFSSRSHFPPSSPLSPGNGPHSEATGVPCMSDCLKQHKPRQLTRATAHARCQVPAPRPPISECARDDGKSRARDRGGGGQDWGVCILQRHVRRGHSSCSAKYCSAFANQQATSSRGHRTWLATIHWKATQGYDCRAATRRAHHHLITFACTFAPGGKNDLETVESARGGKRGLATTEKRKRSTREQQQQ
ncbi:hypothetical protein LZ32DRAFT_175472 [Colletotrichum eremochloae]|nr:hypothetical protein LZ32DRAFT_175472 [Colletotrichum eremochloae]